MIGGSGPPVKGGHHCRVPPVHLVLASASPARRALLRAAAIEAEAVVSDVDEEAVVAEMGTDDPEALVATLARAKAVAVADRCVPEGRPTLVLGCDSLFTIDGRTWGKPASAAEATVRIRALRGRCGVLRTGHHLVEVGGRAVSGVEATTVRFGPMSDAEVDAYVATGEPLGVAGSFTLDGRSAPFIDGVDGDHTNVVGLSLPLLRRLLADLDRSITDLWSTL